MATEPWTDMKIDLARFSRNRNRVPLEYFDAYFGRHVAWHKDGTHIVASGKTDDELQQQLRELGLPEDEVVCEYVSDADGQL